MFKPLNGFIVGVLIEETVAVGQIVIPQNAQTAQSASLRRGTIIAVADDAVGVKVGQIVYFPGPLANVLLYDGKYHFLIQTASVVGVSDPDPERDKPNNTPPLIVPNTAKNRRAGTAGEILAQ